MRQMLSALQHLWNREIVHCNIKGGNKPNAIVDCRGKLTLIDFESAVRRHELIDQGYSKPIIGGCKRKYVGNPHYVAPEVLLPQPGRNPYGQTRFGRRRDVFSAGVVFAELLLDIKHLLQEVDCIQQIIEAHEILQQTLRATTAELALNQYGDFVVSDQRFNRAAAALVAKMLTQNRIKRPSPEQLLRDPFFRTGF